jgi:hypothetical protein
MPSYRVSVARPINVVFYSNSCLILNILFVVFF